VLLIIASPTGKVQTVMSPGLEWDDAMVKGRDAIDEMMQHHVQKAMKGVKLSILAKMVPEVVEWGEEVEGEARTVSAFGKLQTAVVRFIKGPLQAKAAAAQEQALKGKIATSDAFCHCEEMPYRCQLFFYSVPVIIATVTQKGDFRCTKTESALHNFLVSS